MKWLTPFASTDDNGATVHFSCDRVLKAVGLPITDENMLIAATVLVDMLTDINPQAKIILEYSLQDLVHRHDATS